jgi:hypothetical protein
VRGCVGLLGYLISAPREGMDAGRYFFVGAYRRSKFEGLWIHLIYLPTYLQVTLEPSQPSSKWQAEYDERWSVDHSREVCHRPRAPHAHASGKQQAGSLMSSQMRLLRSQRRVLRGQMLSRKRWRLSGHQIMLMTLMLRRLKDMPT